MSLRRNAWRGRRGGDVTLDLSCYGNMFTDGKITYVNVERIVNLERGKE